MDGGDGGEDDEEGTRFDPPAGGESNGCEGFLSELGLSGITGSDGNDDGGDPWLPEFSGGGGEKGVKGGDGGEIGLFGCCRPFSIGFVSGC